MITKKSFFSWFWRNVETEEGPELKRGPSSVYSYHMVGRPRWTPQRYDALCHEGFCSNVIVYRAVNLIARGVASIPFKDADQVLPLFKKPNDLQDWGSFMEAVVSTYLLSGNVYIEACPEKNGHIGKLSLLRPDRVAALPNNNKGKLCGYVVRERGVERRFHIHPETGRSSLLHLKTFHPLNEWYGLSPLEAAARAIDQHNEVSTHNLALLQNGGRPSGALVVDGKNTYLTADQREELRSTVKNVFSGASNAGRSLVLEGDFKWEEMGLSPKDMDFCEGKKMSGREIAQAFGVPPMLVGITGDATFSNFREARLHLWEETILPLAERLLRSLKAWLMTQDLSVQDLRYDLDQVPALAPKREALWNRITGAGFLTTNEKREILGFEPLVPPEEATL